MMMTMMSRSFGDYCCHVHRRCHTQSQAAPTQIMIVMMRIWLLLRKWCLSWRFAGFLNNSRRAFLVIRAFTVTWFGDLQWWYHLKISMMTIIVMMVDVSRVYPAPDDNDDVTNWRGRECGQIVFYYPSMTMCVPALHCNFNHNVCIIHHGSLCCAKLCHYPSCQALTKRKVKNILLFIRTYY